MKNKALRITVRTIALILAILFFLLFVVYMGEKIIFAHFFYNADSKFATPGISDGYVPQGFELYVPCGINARERQAGFLACGYMKDKSASRVYVLAKETGEELYYVEMKEADGSDYTGHTGGITYYGMYLYVSGGDGCDIFLLKDLFDGDNKITKVGEVKTGNNPAYCKVFDGKLYAGSFHYAEGGYVSPDEHMLTTPSGDKNSAVITVFELDINTGLAKSETPVCVYSTPGKVQGMYISDTGSILLSTSWGLSTSHLYEYDISLASVGAFNFEGSNVPLTYLDSKCLVRDVRMPPMAEEIIYIDGEVYVMTESACSKYIFGNFTSGRRVWAYEMA
ncbi:MAG: hypothetical protein IJW19_00945 [Clostridia bacterium]|nr:hypothetical protein [Clostridia bacterium]